MVQGTKKHGDLLEQMAQLRLAAQASLTSTGDTDTEATLPQSHIPYHQLIQGHLQGAATKAAQNHPPTTLVLALN